MREDRISSRRRGERTFSLSRVSIREAGWKWSAAAAYFAVLLILGTDTGTAQTEMYPVPGTCGVVTANAVGDLPPCSADMPAEVCAAFHAIDSLCRSHFPYDLPAWLETLSTEQLVGVLRRYRRIRDHDPILWREYCTAAALSSAYRTNPFQFIEVCFDEDERRHQYTLTDPEKAILGAAYVCHVRIDGRSSQIDTTRREILERFCSEALVLRRFIGEVIPDSRECSPDAHRYLQIEWSQTLPGRGGVVVVDWERYRKFRTEYLNPGAEFLVILRLWDMRLEGGQRAYRIVMTGSHCNFTPAVFPVRDGMIIDEENVFQLGCAIPMDVFQAYVRRLTQVVREENCSM